MCGICGIINIDKTKVDNASLRKMQSALKHRGPDGSGEAISERVGLAMRRLSIIDVSGGDQPLFNEDKTIEIVGNGEIYNYLELQKELIRKGHKLRTGSDIETAVHAYEEWGPSAVKKFRGQFALALHDKINKKVFLIRDRMGEKPLYYTQTENSVAFSSEIKSLIKIQWFDKELDFEAINQFFHFYFIPEPNTPFKNVKKVKPGSYKEIDYNTGLIKEYTYWDPIKIKSTKKSIPTSVIKKTFEEACTLTLRSDVPVGISLSGGIDSGAILAFSAPKYKDVMNAFSVGYEGAPETDEREMAKKLAKEFKVNYIDIEIKTKDVVKNFPEIVKRSDDPVADIAAHSIYEVSKVARKHGVKVLLGGAGGDELFWGYPSSVDAVNQNIANVRISSLLKKDFFYNNPNPKTTGAVIEKFYGREFNSKVNKSSYKSELGKPEAKNKLSNAKHYMNKLRDLWLLGDVITLSDRMAMAASVESRSPFLDYKLVEVSLSYMKNVTSYEQGNKYYFKKAMRGILPDEVMARPKRGFTPPVSKWILGITKKYSHLIRNGFLVNEGILDKSKVGLASVFLKNIPTYTAYHLLVMEMWGRIFVYNQKIK